ncbi:MAG: peptidase MA family metallohydrolase [Candidatus Promineifilaceae bacterium]
MTSFYTILLTLIPTFFLLVSFGAAQDGVLVLDPSVDYTFGEEIRFSLQVQHASGLEGLTLFFRPELSQHVYEVEVPFQPGEVVSVTQSIDVENIELQPFSDITYSWEYVTDGETNRLPDQVVTYEDDRYHWQKMVLNETTAHWVGGLAQFGQRILDITTASLHDLEALVPLEEVSPIDIYMYPSQVELREALAQNDTDNFQTSRLDLGVILLSTADESTAEIELPQSIPYEVAQLILYRAAGSSYSSLPWWFREGIAGSIRQNTNPQHEQSLAEAVQIGETIPFRDLCDQPQIPGLQQDLAAYQSASFVHFLRESPTTDKMPALLLAYLNGRGCEEGVEQVMGQTLDALEQDWLDSLTEPAPLESFFKNLMVWIIILLAGTALIFFLIWATIRKEK